MRVILDTNIWRHIADADAVPLIAGAARKHGARILMPPSIAYECLRIPDDATRRRVMKVVTDLAWVRLMPEAYSECNELLSEIRRVRPGWLRRNPRLDEIRRLRYDWLRRRGGFWERAATGPHKEYAAVRALGDRDLQMARLESYQIRESVAANAPRAAEHTPLQKVFGAMAPATPGWEGEPIEYWRLPALTNTWGVLHQYAHPYREWLDGYIDVPTVLSDRSSFNRFWLYEVTTMNLPRFWLRAAFEFLQAWRRVTDGTPCDSQLSTYLLESEVLATADKNFVYFTERCRAEGPFRVAKPQLIRGDSTAVEQVISLLERGLQA